MAPLGLAWGVPLKQRPVFDSEKLIISTNLPSNTQREMHLGLGRILTLGGTAVALFRERQLPDSMQSCGCTTMHPCCFCSSLNTSRDVLIAHPIPTAKHSHTHAHVCTHMHAHFLTSQDSCKGRPLSHGHSPLYNMGSPVCQIPTHLSAWSYRQWTLKGALIYALFYSFQTCLFSPYLWEDAGRHGAAPQRQDTWCWTQGWCSW